MAVLFNLILFNLERFKTLLMRVIIIKKLLDISKFHKFTINCYRCMVFY